MEASKRWFDLGIAGALVALIALAIVLVPGAQAQKASYVNCGNKKITIQIEDGEGGTRPYKVNAKAVQVKSVTCADAVKFIGHFYSGDAPGKYGYPENYKCKEVDFAVPEGYMPQLCTRGSKGIKFGAQGG
ncbi:MAG TPA: hypothetical protein VFJ57_13265 [Solirubrobacterales bacterium]|nr:hypothetical protein [Solirubrobacterales bacterium]